MKRKKLNRKSVFELEGKILTSEFNLKEADYVLSVFDKENRRIKFNYDVINERLTIYEDSEKIYVNYEEKK